MPDVYSYGFPKTVLDPMPHFRHVFISPVWYRLVRTKVHHVTWRRALQEHVVNVRPSSPHVSQSRLYSSNLGIYRPSDIWR